MSRRTQFILLVALVVTLILGMGVYLYFENKNSAFQKNAVATLESSNDKSHSKVIFHNQTVDLKEGQEAAFNFIQSAYLIKFKGKTHLKFLKSNPQKEESPLLVFIDTFEKIKILRNGSPKKLNFFFNDMSLSPVEFNQALESNGLITISHQAGNDIELSTDTSHSKIDSEERPLTTNQKIRSIVLKNQSKIKRCQLNRMKDVGVLQGKIVMGLVIQPNGLVSEAKILNSNINDIELDTCLISLFSRLRFPTFSQNELYRSFPIEFE